MKAQTTRGVLVAVMTAAILAGGSAVRADDLAGKGSIGFAMGSMLFTGGEHLTSGRIRPMFRGMFKYAWEEHWVSVIESGYGWNSYGEGGGYDGPIGTGTLAIVTPLTAGLDYRFESGNPKIIPRFGAGAGAYAVTIRSGRDRISRDRITDRKRIRTSPGFYLKGGTEWLIKPSLVLNGDLLWHYALSRDEEKFPDGFFTSNVSFAEFRVGINYYFKIRSTGAAPTRPPEEEEEEE
jgi:hypothetical protein